MKTIAQYKNVLNMTNIELAGALGVTPRTISTMANRALKPIEMLAFEALESRLDSVSHHVTIEVKYGSSGYFNVSKENRDKKRYARDYQHNFSDQALIVAREYCNEMLTDGHKFVLHGGCINRGDHYVFTITR